MSLCIITRFKNERHILYEWVHHHLEEGISKVFMINHDSNDQYLERNTWLYDLIEQDKIELLKSTSDNQYLEYDAYLHLLIHKFYIYP